MLDDELRQTALEDELDEELEDIDIDAFYNEQIEVDKPPFLGMRPVERMFLSIFFFMNVFILGLALLVATDRIVF